MRLPYTYVCNFKIMLQFALTFTHDDAFERLLKPSSLLTDITVSWRGSRKQASSQTLSQLPNQASKLVSQSGEQASSLVS